MIKEDTLVENISSPTVDNETTSMSSTGKPTGSSEKQEKPPQQKQASEPNSPTVRRSTESAKIATNRQASAEAILKVMHMHDNLDEGYLKLSTDATKMEETGSKSRTKRARKCKALYYAPSYENMMISAKNGTLGPNDGSFTPCYSVKLENMSVDNVENKSSDKEKCVEEKPVGLPIKKTKGRYKSVPVSHNVNRTPCDVDVPSSSKDEYVNTDYGEDDVVLSQSFTMQRQLRQRTAKNTPYYNVDDPTSTSEDEFMNKSGENAVTIKYVNTKRQIRERKAKMVSSYIEGTTSCSEDESVDNIKENSMIPNHVGLHEAISDETSVVVKKEYELPKPIVKRQSQSHTRHNLKRVSTFVNKSRWTKCKNDGCKVVSSNHITSKRLNYKRRPTAAQAWYNLNKTRCTNNSTKKKFQRNVFAKQRQSRPQHQQHQAASYTANKLSHFIERNVLNSEEVASTLKDIITFVDFAHQGNPNSEDLGIKLPVDTITIINNNDPSDVYEQNVIIVDRDIFQREEVQANIVEQIPPKEITGEEIPNSKCVVIEVYGDLTNEDDIDTGSVSSETKPTTGNNSELNTETESNINNPPENITNDESCFSITTVHFTNNDVDENLNTENDTTDNETTKPEVYVCYLSYLNEPDAMIETSTTEGCQNEAVDISTIPLTPSRSNNLEESSHTRHEPPVTRMNDENTTTMVNVESEIHNIPFYEDPELVEQLIYVDYAEDGSLIVNTEENVPGVDQALDSDTSSRQDKVLTVTHNEGTPSLPDTENLDLETVYMGSAIVYDNDVVIRDDDTKIIDDKPVQKNEDLIVTESKFDVTDSNLPHPRSLSPNTLNDPTNTIPEACTFFHDDDFIDIETVELPLVEPDSYTSIVIPGEETHIISQPVSARLRTRKSKENNQTTICHTSAYGTNDPHNRTVFHEEDYVHVESVVDNEHISEAAVPSPPVTRRIRSPSSSLTNESPVSTPNICDHTLVVPTSITSEEEGTATLNLDFVCVSLPQGNVESIEDWILISTDTDGDGLADHIALPGLLSMGVEQYLVPDFTRHNSSMPCQNATLCSYNGGISAVALQCPTSLSIEVESWSSPTLMHDTMNVEELQPGPSARNTESSQSFSAYDPSFDIYLGNDNDEGSTTEEALYKNVSSTFFEKSYFSAVDIDEVSQQYLLLLDPSFRPTVTLEIASTSSAIQETPADGLNNPNCSQGDRCNPTNETSTSTNNVTLELPDEIWNDLDLAIASTEEVVTSAQETHFELPSTSSEIRLEHDQQLEEFYEPSPHTSGVLEIEMDAVEDVAKSNS